MRKACVLVGLLACGGGGGNSDAPADAAIDSPAPCTHIQNLRMVRGRSLQFGSTVGRFEGMICVEGRPELGCATTDIDGRFQVCAPSGVDFALRLNKPGFDNALHLHGPGSSGAILDDFNAGQDAYLLANIWMPLNVPYPADSSHGNLVASLGKLDALQKIVPVENATVSILPVNGLVVRYLNAMGMSDDTLNATTASSTAVIGKVPVGEYDLQVNGATGCAPMYGGYASPDNSQTARVTVAPASTTILAIKCQ